MLKKSLSTKDNSLDIVILSIALSPSYRNDSFIKHHNYLVSFSSNKHKKAHNQEKERTPYQKNTIFNSNSWYTISLFSFINDSFPYKAMIREEPSKRKFWLVITIINSLSISEYVNGRKEYMSSSFSLIFISSVFKSYSVLNYPFSYTE